MAKRDKHEAFEGDALNGMGRAWGVKTEREIVYETMFVEATAKRLAKLCDAKPSAGWLTHSAALEREGYDLSDPATTC